MPFYSISTHARSSQASPSVTLERGAYRMRAPPKRSGLSFGLSQSSADAGAPATPRRIRRRSQALSRDGLPDVLQHEKQIAMVVMLLVCGTVSCFGIAYYLFSTSPRVRI